MSTRKSHKRQPRQSRFGVVLALFACVFFIALLILSAGLFFKVSDIRVEGVVMISEDGVREHCGIQLQSNILLLDKFAVSRSLFAAFPYAREVMVRRQLPGTVIITVTEADPACAFVYQNRYWIADRDGRVLENRAALGEVNFPVVKGVVPLAPSVGDMVVFAVGEEDKQYALFPLLDALDAAGLLTRVGEIDVTRSHEVSLVCDGRLTVLVGFPNDLEYKLSYIGPSLERLEPEQRARLDVSAARDKNALLIPEG